MIARVWHGQTDRDRVDEYNAYLRETGIHDLRKTPGNRRVLVLWDRSGEFADVTLISFWDSEESVRAFAGDDLLKARYYPRDPEFLRELEPRVTHLEVAADEA